MSAKTDNNKKKHFFIFSLQVIAFRGEEGRTHPVNIIANSEENHVNRHMLQNVQNQAFSRFYAEGGDPEKDTIQDVFVAAISPLGRMSNNEFYGREFVAQQEEEAAKAHKAANDASTES